MTKKVLITLIALVLILALFVLIEFLYIRFNGKPVSSPDIPRTPETSGTGHALTYVVMGDSTSISQGGTYDNGFARASAKHLAKNYTVTMINTGISGATAKTVLAQQLPEAIKHRPHVVLLAVGANDVTHRTDLGNIQRDIQAIVDGLKSANPKVKIVVTRSPAVDAVTRFPIGAKQLIKLRVNQVNHAFEPLVAKNNLTVAPVAEETRQAFLDDPSLLAQDNFHPNDRGYALWIPVITRALDRALGQ